VSEIERESVCGNMRASCVRKKDTKGERERDVGVPMRPKAYHSFWKNVKFYLTLDTVCLKIKIINFNLKIMKRSTLTALQTFCRLFRFNEIVNFALFEV
jgi:hypothetical protein